jgi:N-acetylglucosaminyldiphosphoundecaprenol N-acetyl-beta-D-mannosaminyltransferase
MKISKINLFNLNIANLTMQEAINEIIRLLDSNKKSFVVTPNVDHLVKLNSDPYFREIYSKADLILADGTPIVWASRLLKTPLKEKVSGSDLFNNFALYAEKNAIKLFFLGAGPGIAALAAENLSKKYPEIIIVGTYSPSFNFEKDQIENKKIIETINHSGADLLFVGLGAPKQEKWIYENKDKLSTVKVSIGVGASFDFTANSLKRAPLWMQRNGLEWFYRLCSEPRRLFSRYVIESPRFFYFLFLEILKKIK